MHFAKQLECDEDEAAFDEKLRQIAQHKLKPKASPSEKQKETWCLRRQRKGRAVRGGGRI